MGTTPYWKAAPEPCDDAEYEEAPPAWYPDLDDPDCDCWDPENPDCAELEEPDEALREAEEPDDAALAPKAEADDG